MLTRRDVVGKLAAGTAFVWAAGMARTGMAATRPEPSTPAGAQPDENLAAESAPPRGVETTVATVSAPPPWELLQPLALGSVVAHGWHLAGLTDVVHGACVVTLQNERGRAHRVHLCRNEGTPQGLVYTKQLDLLVMNGGQGDLPTDEGFAQAVAELAHVVARNESQREQVVASLLPQAERVRRFAGPTDSRLR
jgi:hypothetical protein